MSDKQHNVPSRAATVGDGKEEVPRGAEFHCTSCGYRQVLPEELLGRQAKCPKCAQMSEVTYSPQRGAASAPQEDLLESCPLPAASARSTAQENLDPLALDATPYPETAGGQLRHFFSGNLPANVFSGLGGGVYVCLVCLALSMLAFTVDSAAGLMPHALLLLLLPAIFCSVLLALNGRLAVSVGAPEPSAVLCVFLLLAALGADLSGRVPAPVFAATLLAALALSGVLSGLLGVLLSRLGLAERVRFLPGEVMGGMLAGFGLLLIKAWFMVMTASDPSLAALGTVSLNALGPALADAWTAWAPAAAFGVLYFAVRMSGRSLAWPLLLVVLAVGGWNVVALHLVSPPASWSAFLPAGLAGSLAELQAALTGTQAHLPQLLTTSCYLELLDPSTLAHIHWSALAARAEFFVAVAAVAILPSIVRTSILESVLCRDADADEQMRLVGASSILSGALGGLPASLSLSSSLGLRALGATGPLAGFTVGLVCLGVLLSGQPFLQFIPKFVPLGILLGTGLTMPMSWLLGDARNPLSRKDDLRAAWASCLAVVLLGPVLGVFVSLGLGVVGSLSRAVADGGVRFLQTGDVYHSNVDRSPSEHCILRERGGQILILRLQGFLFLGMLYGLVRTIKDHLGAAGSNGLKYVILDVAAVSGMGASAAIGFRRLEALAREHGMLLFITSVPLEMEEHLEGLGYRMGDDAGVCRIALNMDYALEWCEDAILVGAKAEGTDESERHRGTMEELLAASFPEPRLVPMLMKCLERQEVPRKAYIIKQGDASDAMYFLQAGKVNVELALPGGKVLRLKKMGPGTVFGEMGLYTSAPRSASVIAIEKCVVYKLSLARFKLIQAKVPQLAAAVNRFVVGLLAERVAEANAQTRATQG